MCTAIALSHSGLFGRTLDLEYHYDESVVITPRRYYFSSPSGHCVQGEYAMIGIATMVEGYPLYYDGMNEHGLCMAGLHFPGNGVYLDPIDDMENVPPYALIPRILSSCKTLQEAQSMLTHIRLVHHPFSEQFPLTPLHWMIAQNGESIVVEPIDTGLQIYDNPVGVMSNNPTFDTQLALLLRYSGLSPDEPDNYFIDPSQLPHAYRGLGCIGLPGDYSSPSRFVRGVYLSSNTPNTIGSERVSHFFRIMEGVSIPKGALRSSDNKWVHTVYTSCCDPSSLCYYYNTYTHSAVVEVKLSCKSETDQLISYPLRLDQSFLVESPIL